MQATDIAVMILYGENTMSEEIKKEAQDVELNLENLEMAAGGTSAFDGRVPPFCSL